MIQRRAECVLLRDANVPLQLHLARLNLVLLAPQRAEEVPYLLGFRQDVRPELVRLPVLLGELGAEVADVVLARAGGGVQVVPRRGEGRFEEVDLDGGGERRVGGEGSFVATAAAAVRVASGESAVLVRLRRVRVFVVGRMRIPPRRRRPSLAVLRGEGSKIFHRHLRSCRRQRVLQYIFPCHGARLEAPPSQRRVIIPAARKAAGHLLLLAPQRYGQVQQE
mmetsp:Transcript_47248/g.143064  ORF Transcript_47248/g.143064 Transcript_47248/m.143064 type:complete len:222 (+) Transcript_47248:770-1435(+)